MIEVALIVKPQGIKGEVKATLSTNVEKVFKNVKWAMVGGKRLEIASITLRQGFLYVKFQGINDRNEAEKLRNQPILIEKDLLLDCLEGDELLVDDMIGMMVYDSDGDYAGQIVEIENYGASDIIVLEREGRKSEIPYIDGLFEVKDGKLIADKSKLLEVMV